MKEPIIVHSEEDYERAQRRVRELEAAEATADKERELQALAEAMLAFELRRDSAEE
ncbi:hypothetical protein [Bosea sp. Root381]|uniref:hypothetical protein n=1 Tax=Bosea sp. Root381 TaxID=1736524 RepID=UPI000A5DD8A5|nr:hypothetical protein [Bosea sp. Root381]